MIDSRTATDTVRRRRGCQGCGYRFSTLERIEHRLPLIVKRDGRREPFSADKVLHGIKLACRKRPFEIEDLHHAVHKVERRLIQLKAPEVASSNVGEAVMETLREMDPVAYVRFASVYRQFESVEQFAEAVLPLQDPRE